MTDTMQLPRQMLGAEVRAQSFDEAANTIDIIWTTGATVRRRHWMDGPYDEELLLGAANVRLDRLNAGAPFLNTHSAWSLEDVIGSVVPGTAKLEKGRGVATVLLSRAAADADTIGKIRDGVIRNISAGYLVHVVEKTERDSRVPLWRITDWEPLEISAVPIPADAGAQVRSHQDGKASAELFPCRVIRSPISAAAASRARMRMRNGGR